MKEPKQLSVSAIESGTVIDHIPASGLFKVIQILGLDKIDNQITFGTNLESKKNDDALLFSRRLLAVPEYHPAGGRHSVRTRARRQFDKEDGDRRRLRENQPEGLCPDLAPR